MPPLPKLNWKVPKQELLLEEFAPVEYLNKHIDTLVECQETKVCIKFKQQSAKEEYKWIVIC